jgi:thiosulfate/3-mercaptopyruvate sulfurtransferase
VLQSKKGIGMGNYARPEVLVETQWVAEHLTDPNTRLLEADRDVTNYEEGHLPGAVFWNTFTTLLRPDYKINFDKGAVEHLLSQSGITNETTVIIYSGHPAIAPWVFWFLKGFGHRDVRLMNGGRKKWLAEGHQLTKDLPTPKPTTYQIQDFDQSFRADRQAVLEAMRDEGAVLLDVRTQQEYSGEWFMLEPPKEGERAGHIPGTAYLYYERALQEDGTFKPREELKMLYESQGVTPEKAAITYCAVGIRASHTWFVLRYLLGYQQVRNYDASWNDWGRQSDTPIER